MHHNLLLAWLAAFFLLSTSFIKAANQANYDASIILVMHLKNSVLT